MSAPIYCMEERMKESFLIVISAMVEAFASTYLDISSRLPFPESILYFFVGIILLFLAVYLVFYLVFEQLLRLRESARKGKN